MNLNEIKSRLNNFNKSGNLSKDTYAFGDFIDFLQKSSNDMIPMIINGEDIWLFSLVVPKDKLVDGYVDKLINWSIHAARYGYYRNHNNEYFLSKPCEGCMPEEILEDAIPVFYQREMFAGKKFDVEINQQISHVLGLAKLDEVDEPNNYYKLDKGDFVKVVDAENDILSIHTMKKDDLDKFLSISNSVLIRFFVCTISGRDVTLTFKKEFIKDEENGIFYIYLQNSDMGYAIKQIRGFQVIYPEKDFDEYEKETKFETFLIKDLESGNLIKHTCNPDKVSNRFTKKDYPLDLSSVYFSKDVLDKYKKDSEKFTIEDRSITCRDYWDVRYFMSDDKSQVIVYLCDLSSLPYEEQKHWKRFNEEPKSNIPSHIIKNDFLGEWHDLVDPLKMLKNNLRQFPKCKFKGNEVSIWEEKNKGSIRSLDNLGYLMDGSKDEWEREINKLWQICVEGLNRAKINKLAEYYGCSKGSTQSIDNLHAILNELGIGSVEVDAITKPLYELNGYRQDVDHSRKIMKYPSELPNKLIEIYNDLIRRLWHAFEYLSRFIKSGKLNLE